MVPYSPTTHEGSLPHELKSSGSSVSSSSHALVQYTATQTNSARDNFMVAVDESESEIESEIESERERESTTDHHGRRGKKERMLRIFGLLCMSFFRIFRIFRIAYQDKTLQADHVQENMGFEMLKIYCIYHTCRAMIIKIQINYVILVESS